MKLVCHLHARSMLRGHAAFWRHAQTVALATILSETKLAIASVYNALMHAYFVFVLPSHWAGLSAISAHFLRFSCFSGLPFFPWDHLNRSILGGTAFFADPAADTGLVDHWEVSPV